MFRKKIETVSVIILFLCAIVSSGCGGAQSGSETAKADNINKAPTTAVINSSVPANPSSTQPVVVNNGSVPTMAAATNKKPSPQVKEPTPQIGSGGDDMSLFTQARGALSSDKELSNAVIIEIKEGNVTLNGKVSSETQKAKALQLVQSVKGIKSVKNNLRVSS